MSAFVINMRNQSKASSKMLGILPNFGFQVFVKVTVDLQRTISLTHCKA